ncbi:MAG: efflux RND transporter periplasmic adaptor subunit [Candidatus Eremiobacteraeota bacterium]|nr:efflux RND transporter periplasmic adaptor subunit [Candidatus Eremiobacteraeota bacterium]
MKNRTRNIIIVVVALVAVIAFALFTSGSRKQPAIPVKTTAIALTTFTVKLPENGVVMHPGTLTVPTLVAGNIVSIAVRAGDRVSAGQTLAIVDNPTIASTASGSQADYDSAVANVSAARINEENAKVQYQASVATQKSARDEAKRVYDADAALLQQRAIARTVVDADKAKLDQAQVAYDQALEQLRLGAVSGYGQNSIEYAQAAADKARIVNQQSQEQVAFTRVDAPESGIIQTVAAQPSDPMRSLQQGDAVTAGQALFTMASTGGFIVRAQVDEQDIINVRVGQRANITGQDFPGKTIPGHVAVIAPVAQKSTDASSTAKQVLTTIALDRSPDFLKDGMTADVDILTTDISHAIVVPNDAVTKSGNKSYVYVVKNGTARKKQIVPDRVGDTTTLVKSGLLPGDTIVAQSQPTLKDGAKVTPLPSASPGASSGP